MTVDEAAPPAAKPPTLQITGLPPAPETAPCEDDADTKLTPVESRFVTVTTVAPDGPALVTEIAFVTLAPKYKETGVLDMATPRPASGLIGLIVVRPSLHPHSITPPPHARSTNTY